MQKNNKRKPGFSGNIEEKQLLTKRELEIALLITKEFSHKMIADALKIKVRSVSTHVHNIHNKTHTHNAAGIATYMHHLKRKSK